MPIKLPQKLPTTTEGLEKLLPISQVKAIPDEPSYENIRTLCDRLSDLPRPTVDQSRYFVEATNLMYDYEQIHYPIPKVE